MVSLTGLMNRDLNSLFMPYNSPARGAGGAPKSEAGQTLTDSIPLNPSLTNNSSYTVRILVERISVQFSSVTGTTAPAQAQADPLDLSAEATAQRIFDFSTSLFEVYQAQHPDETEENAFADFEQLVQDAVEKGLEEARSMLDGLGKLDDPTNEFITNVQSLLDALLDAFFHPENAEGTGESETSSESPTNSWAQFELEYQYFCLEFTAAGKSANDVPETAADFGQGNGPTNTTPTSFVRFQAESLSIALSYSQGNSTVPDVQLLA